MEAKRELTIVCHGASKGSWKLLSDVLKALTGARHVTISPRLLTEEMSHAKITSTRGREPANFDDYFRSCEAGGRASFGTSSSVHADVQTDPRQLPLL